MRKFPRSLPQGCNIHNGAAQSAGTEHRVCHNIQRNIGEFSDRLSGLGGIKSSTGGVPKHPGEQNRRLWGKGPYGIAYIRHRPVNPEVELDLIAERVRRLFRAADNLAIHFGRTADHDDTARFRLYTADQFNGAARIDALRYAADIAAKLSWRNFFFG